MSVSLRSVDTDVVVDTAVVCGSSFCGSGSGAAGRGSAALYNPDLLNLHVYRTFDSKHSQKGFSDPELLQEVEVQKYAFLLYLQFPLRLHLLLFL